MGLWLFDWEERRSLQEVEEPLPILNKTILYTFLIASVACLSQSHILPPQQF